MTGGWPQLLWLTFLLIAGAWLVCALVVPALIAACVSRVRDPAIRGRRILLAAAFPWLVAMAMAAAVVVTAAFKAAGWIADHCPHHGLGHPHLCFSHLPALELGIWHGAFAGVLAVSLAWRGARYVRSQRAASRKIRLLKALASSRGRLRILSARAPLALAGGVLEPVILLSRGLLDQLSFRERRIVAAHEAAHLRHGDALRSAAFELLLVIHVPWVRRKLRASWVGFLEEQADDAVAQRFGAEGVVETLLHVARLELRQQTSGFSVAGTDLPGRARRLLAGGTGDEGRLPWFESAYALVLATVFTTAVMGHHALESLLGLVTGH